MLFIVVLTMTKSIIVVHSFVILKNTANKKIAGCSPNDYCL